MENFCKYAYKEACFLYAYKEACFLKQENSIYIRFLSGHNPAKSSSCRYCKKIVLCSSNFFTSSMCFMLCYYLQLSPGDSVIDVKQFLLDAPETCFYTCYDLILHSKDGSTHQLEDYNEISEIADITSGGCSLEMVAGL